MPCSGSAQPNFFLVSSSTFLVVCALSPLMFADRQSCEFFQYAPNGYKPTQSDVLSAPIPGFTIHNIYYSKVIDIITERK